MSYRDYRDFINIKVTMFLIICIVYTDKAFSTLPTANLKCGFPCESATWIHILKRKTSRGADY